MSGILQTLFQNIRSFITGTGWLAQSTAGYLGYFTRAGIDSAGKFYAAGFIDGPSTTRQLTLSRFTTTGTADLNSSLTGTSYPFAASDGFMALTVDSSGNSYLFGIKDAQQATQLIKFNSSGGVVLQQYTRDGSATQTFPRNAVVDSSANIFLAVYRDQTNCCVGFYYPAIIKFDSSGTVVWSKYYNYTNGQFANDVALDTSGNVWCAGTSVLIKANSSGTATLIRSSSNGQFSRIHIDSSNNIYVGGKETSGSNSNLLSVSSTATLIWSRKYVIGTSMSPTNTIATDSSGNVYCALVATDTGVPGFTIILKYNSSGTLQWQRKITSGSTTSQRTYLTDMKISNNNVVIAGYTVTASGPTYQYGLAFSFPTDGSLTGTIALGGNNFVYSIASGTETAGATINFTTQSNVTTNMSVTTTATAYSSATNQLTNTKVTF